MFYISGERTHVTQAAIDAIAAEAEVARQLTGNEAYFQVTGEHALQVADGTTRKTRIHLDSPDPSSPDDRWTMSVIQTIIDSEGAKLNAKRWTVANSLDDAIPHESSNESAELARYIPEVIAAALQALHKYVGEHKSRMPLDPESHNVVIRATNFGDLTALSETARQAGLAEKEQPFEALNRYGLEPVASQQISEGIDLEFSRVIMAQRPMIIVYPSIDGQSGSPKLYYKSNSQGNWRYLAGYSPDDGWYGKGQSEYALSAPIQVQRSLARIETGVEPISVSDAEKSHIIALTTPEIKTSARETYPDDSMHFRRKTLELGSDDNADPHHPQAPDFSNRISTWNSSNALYGEFFVDEFISHDETVRYAFAHDADGRSWLMQADSADGSTEVRSNGLLNQYFYVPGASSGTKLNQPAYEYASMASGMHVSDYHPEDDHYVECFGLGLSRNPIIRSYLHTIDQGDISWKTRLEGVPVWDVGPARRSVIWLEQMTESSHGDIADAVERALQVVAGMERGNPRRVMDYSGIVGNLESFCAATFLAAESLDAPIADDATLPPGSTAFERCGYESGEFVAYDTLLRELGYTEAKREKEKYAKDVYHLYLESEQFPEQPLVLSVDSSGMIGLSKKLSATEAPATEGSGAHF